MRCRDCSEVRGYPYKRNHLAALPTTKDFGRASHLALVAEGTVKIIRENTALAVAFTQPPFCSAAVVFLRIGGGTCSTCT
jgi:hypothetical protein